MHLLTPVINLLKGNYRITHCCKAEDNEYLETKDNFVIKQGVRAD